MPPIETGWSQSKFPQLLPKHRALLLNITNRELWIGTRASKTASTSQKCSICWNGDESIEHTFYDCIVAQNVINTTQKIISEITRKQVTIGPLEFLFGPGNINSPKTRLIWAICRSHALWSLWVLRNVTRTNPDKQSAPITNYNQISIYLLTNLLDYCRVLRFTDAKREQLWSKLINRSKSLLNQIISQSTPSQLSSQNFPSQYFNTPFFYYSKIPQQSTFYS